jgi:hypothetical protein
LLSGVFGGVVALFKIALLPIVGCFWLLASVRLTALEPERRAPNLLRTMVPVAAGFAVPAGACILYFAQAETLDLVAWTFFDYPFQLMGVMVPKLHTLLDGLSWFIPTFAPLFPLAAVGAIVSLRKDYEVNALGWVTWIVVGLLSVLYQRISWWQYHYYAVSVPLGLLATMGLDSFVRNEFSFARPRSTATTQRLAIALLGALFLPMAWTVVVKTGVLTVRGLAFTQESRHAFQATVDDQYKLIPGDLSYLQSVDDAESVFFIGDPRYYFLSHRVPEVRFPLGWSVPVTSQYQEIYTHITTNRPKHIFLRRGVFEDLRALTPSLEGPNRALESYITSNYAVAEDSPRGTWYVFRQE